MAVQNSTNPRKGHRRERRHRDRREGAHVEDRTRIVQRKRRPTSNVDSMMVLRARRGGTGSKYVTLRGGLRPPPPESRVRT